MIDDSGEWWKGSEPADIEEFLREWTRFEEAYPVDKCLSVRCDCGCERFRLMRAWNTTQRTCTGCGQVRYIARFGDNSGWEEAAGEEAPEPYRCVECGGSEANVVVGFAGYEDNPELDSVKWFYVGVHCANCGILGCFNDGKVGRGPAAEVAQQVVG